MPTSGSPGCSDTRHDTLTAVGSKMNPTAINAGLSSPFVGVALPIVFAVFLASWIQNKRFDDMNRRFDDVNRRFDEILARLIRMETKLDNHEERLIPV